jgi:hypothetical protein
VNDLLEVFQTNIGGRTVKVELMGEKALDDGGVFRDVISEFWDGCFRMFFEGDRECVPIVTPELGQRQYDAIGHILYVGYKQLGFFPIRFCRASLISVMFPDKPDNTLLMDSFYHYLCEYEAKSIKEALAGEPIEGDIQTDLEEIHSRYGCRQMPTSGNVHKYMQRIAEVQLLENSNFPLQNMETYISKLKEFPDFKTPGDILKMYQKLRPTGRKVARLMKAVPPAKNITEEKIFGYLDKYCKDLSDVLLPLFVRFCTGSTTVCVKEILVTFVYLKGLKRRFVAHTCGSALEVPSTYLSYNEFATEFSNQLTSGHWEMQIC